MTHRHRRALSKQKATAWEKCEGFLLRGEMFLASISRACAPVGIIVIAMSTCLASDTVYEPSASDPRVVAALAAQKRLGDVMLALDMVGIETLMAPDLLVNAPINKVANRENVIARLQASKISYEPGYEPTIDFAGVRGDVVVIMGEEVTHPNKDAPYAGKIEHRRFTDVWKQFDGVWKLWIRQATITKVE